MSSNDLLAKLGLYFRPAFLDREACARLRQVLGGAPAAPAEVYRDRSANAVNLQARRTLSVDPPPAQVAFVEQALDGLRDDLSRHFRVALTTRELTDYLAYGPGTFFRPHVDCPPAAEQVAGRVRRRVSSVVFLSAPPPGAGAEYEGGELRFYRLIDGAAWRDVGLTCEATQGLLVAFPADVLHEVTPVTAGRRCTAVTWFSGP